MKRLMFCTIGTGRDLASTFQISLDEFGPTRIVFLTSEKSRRKNLPEVFELFFDSETAAEHVRAIEDAEGCFVVEADAPKYAGTTLELPLDLELEKINEAETLALAYRRKILERVGSEAQQLFADFTRGTKPMSAALFDAASALGFDRLNYVSGERNENGMVVAGTEESHKVYGRKLRAAEALREAIRLFNDGEYPAAREIAAGYVDDHRSKLPMDGDGFRLVEAASTAYAAWDRFRFDAAQEAFDRLRDEDHIDPQFVGNHFLNADGIRAAKRHFHESSEASSDVEEDYAGLAADLLENARRRASDNAWDDALGRLYRATEYLAQRQIHERFDETTAEFTTNALPDELRDEWGVTGDTCQLGLDRGWELLATVDDELGEAFAELYDDGVRTALHQRNKSILAHGFEPVDEKYVHTLAEAVDTLGELASGRWSRLRDVCEFERIEDIAV
jgi:CRISPR-associated protein (TIGR02710 family)